MSATNASSSLAGEGGRTATGVPGSGSGGLGGGVTLKPVQPPAYFASVETGVYRSDYPSLDKVSFFSQRLKPQTMILLGVEGLAKPVELQLRQQIEGLQLISLAGSSWRNESDLTSEMVIAALGYILDERSHPLVLMCPTGTLQTSVVVGCLRKLQRWTLSSIVEECDCFVLPPAIKVQRRVVEFIEEFALEECFTDPKLRSIWRWRMEKHAASNAGATGELHHTPSFSQKEKAGHQKTPVRTSESGGPAPSAPVPVAGVQTTEGGAFSNSPSRASLEGEEFASMRQNSAIAVGPTTTFSSASGVAASKDQSPLRPVSNLSVSSLQGEGRGFSSFEPQVSDQLLQQQLSEQGIGSSLRESTSALAVAGTPKSTRDQLVLRETPTGSPGSASDGEQSRIGAAGGAATPSIPPTALLIKPPKWFENQLDMDDNDVEALMTRKRLLQGQGQDSQNFSIDQKIFEKKIDFDLLRFARNPPSITTRCKYDKDTILDDDDD